MELTLTQVAKYLFVMLCIGAIIIGLFISTVSMIILLNDSKAKKDAYYSTPHTTTIK